MTTIYATRERHRTGLAATSLCAIGVWLCASECLLAEQAAGTGVSVGGSDTMEFFETRIRPVLAENCFGCHGEETQENGLRLDSLQRMLDGGQFGRAVVPGKPSESLSERLPLSSPLTHRPPTTR